MKAFFEQDDKVLNSQSLVILLVDIAKQRGVHPDKLLKGTKLFYTDLFKQKVNISQRQFVKLINNTIKLVNQADIPFLLGSRLFPTQLEQVGAVLMNTHNLLDMLRVIRCYQQHIFPYMFMVQKQHQQQHHFFFNHAISNEQTTYQQFMCEFLSSLLVSAIKWRLKKLPPLCITFPYAQPAHIEQYQAYLPNCYQFMPKAQQTLIATSVQQLTTLNISIASHWLLEPFTDYNRAIKRHYINQLSSTSQQGGLIQCVLMLIAKTIEQKNTLSLEYIAKRLHISVATLKRKLANHNTSYQQLLDHYRQQQAVFQLTKQGLSNEIVADALNFSDITNFRRSFKRWTGLTPTALKQYFNAFQ